MSQMSILILWFQSLSNIQWNGATLLVEQLSVPDTSIYYTKYTGVLVYRAILE